MATQKNGVNWRLTIRAALIMLAVSLMFSGVYHFDRVSCRTCWQDLMRYFFTLFGSITAFGYAIGWTLPEKPDRPEERPFQWKYRQDFWEGSLGLATLMSVALAFMMFGS